MKKFQGVNEATAKKYSIIAIVIFSFFLFIVLPLFSLLIFGFSYIPVLSEIAVIFITSFILGTLYLIYKGFVLLYEFLKDMFRWGF